MAQTLEENYRETTQEVPKAVPDRVRRATLRDRLGKRFNRTLVGMGLVFVAAVAGLYYFAQAASYESTDDAFIAAHSIEVAPKIAGKIESVPVKDNQQVNKGDLLVEIDPRDYDAQLKQKQAAVESVKSEGAAAQASVEQQLANVSSLQATVEQDKADQQASQAQADQTSDDLRREQDLYKTHVVSIQDLVHSQVADRAAQANLDSARKKVAAAQAQLAVGEAQVRTFEALLQYVLAQVQENDANLDSAKLNDSYTKVYAPETGRVTRKSVEPGDYVQVGQSLMALVPSEIYVTANFKENQVKLMRPGQAVEIQVDALGERKFEGHIDSIQMGSGAAFSLLPPENATGNYVKVVQRIPVKILFNETPEVGLPLGPGESVVPTVKVQDFHYSAFQLLTVVILVAAALLAILWWGTRPPKVKKSA